MVPAPAAHAAGRVRFPLPLVSPPQSPSRTTPVPRRSRVANAVPHKQASRGASPERYSESFDSSGRLPQHSSRFSKLFNLGCVVSMGEYLARGTVGTSPSAYGNGGQGWKAVHGHLGFCHTPMTRRGRVRTVRPALGHAVQGHRRGRCSGRPETVRHTHCSERVGMCQRLSSRRDNDVRGGRVRTHGHAGKACGTTSWRATPRASPLQTLSPLVALHNPTHGDGTCRSSRRTSGAAVSTPRPC